MPLDLHHNPPRIVLLVLGCRPRCRQLATGLVLALLNTR
jgi:hypothetical protein